MAAGLCGDDWPDRIGLHAALPHSPDPSAGRGCDDRVARWRNRDTDPGREPAVQPHPVWRLSGPVHVGRPLAARRQAARAAVWALIGTLLIGLCPVLAGKFHVERA